MDQTLEVVDEIIALNLNSVVYGSMAFGKQMRAQGSGTIVNISSTCATEAWPKFSVYAAAKSGVVSLSKGMYTELRPFGVRVTAVIPGAGATNFSKNAGLAEPAGAILLETGGHGGGDPAHLPDAAAHRGRGISVLGDGSGGDSDVGQRET